jgi:hypothetical protein
MHTLFTALDSIIDFPHPAFQKKLAHYEGEFANINIDEISDDELDTYFEKIHHEYKQSQGDKRLNRLALIGYISHFDVLIEKYFPDYVTIFREELTREPSEDVMMFLEHLEEILRDYTHRLSEPDQHPSYTNHIQELIQNAMIDLFFWLQEEE